MRRPRHDQLDDRLGSKAPRQRSLRLRQVVAVEPGAPMDVLGGNQRPQQRCGGPGIYGNVGPVRQFQGLAGVLGRELDGNIPGDGGDGQYFDFFGRGQGGQERYCVVGRGIGVKDDLHCRDRTKACLNPGMSISQTTLCFTGTSLQTAWFLLSLATPSRSTTLRPRVRPLSTWTSM